MFPVVSVHQAVILLTEGRGGDVTITHDVFDLTVQGPPSPSPSLQPRHLTVQGPLILPPANGIWWPSLETCSNLFTSAPPPTGADMWWLLKHVQPRKRAVIFSEACVKKSVHRWRGCLPQCMLGYTHPPGQTPPVSSRRLLPTGMHYGGF